MPATEEKTVARAFEPEIGENLNQLRSLVQLMQTYGKVVNLTGSLETQALWGEFAEALLAFRLLQQQNLLAQDWIDIGSGGGLPGLVFGILLSQNSKARGILVEPRKRRADFLSLAIAQLGIPRLEAMRGTLSDEGQLEPEISSIKPGWVSARAVFSPEAWMRRSALAWPSAICMIHGQAPDLASFRRVASAAWGPRHVELWRTTASQS